MARNVIVGVLNWGIGHATRMIPVIERLVEGGAAVTLASDGASMELLRSHFPQLPCLALPGYNIQYHTTLPAWWATLMQGKRIQKAIRQENEVLSTWLLEHPTDLIISDNRYGFWSHDLPSYLLTHQYAPAAPTGGGAVAFQMIKRYYPRFDKIYLVDDPKQNLAGRLTQKGWGMHNIFPMGPLSAQAAERPSNAEAPETLVILSGPEPQRTVLADMVEQQLQSYTGSITVVGGSMSDSRLDARYVSYLSPTALQGLFQGCKQMIVRAGYSTLMDLAYLGKPALLIPTPGQPEQEYLASLWSKRGWALTIPQSQFDLESAVQELQHFQPDFPAGMQQAYHQYKGVVDQWLSA